MEGGPADEALLKEWLTQLRNQAGLSQQEVADELGVRRKTVYNAESPKQGNVSGLTLYRMLKLYEALADPPASAPSLSDRLGSLEAEVAEGARDVVLSLQALAERVAALERHVEPGGGQATGESSG